MSHDVLPIKPSVATEPQKRLNVGCGRHFHPQWVNIDLKSGDPAVMQHDITKGIPFQDDYFHVVYHSHVLEHLKPERGIELIRECFRVLKPGGILRVVVPDLERIACLYLEMHQMALDGDEQAKTDYKWIKLELLDQLVREYSGGRMGQYMADPEIQNSEFVRGRVGDEFWICRAPERVCRPHVQRKHPRLSANWRDRARVKIRDFRQKLARRMVGLLLGRSGKEAFDEGIFRRNGEIHRWMYDRFSIRDLCEQIGFESFEVHSAFSSKIDEFAQFELDASEGAIRKPDSLFVECRKPSPAYRQHAA